ncbi:hypothetical protein Dimus_029995, partial [Dionaea muscipula]
GTLECRYCHKCNSDSALVVFNGGDSSKSLVAASYTGVKAYDLHTSFLVSYSSATSRERILDC